MRNIHKIGQNIYITNNEEIGTDEYYFHLKNNEYYNFGRIEEFDKDMKFWRKVILTTDLDLIKDDVQAIDDEFLEWFVKNPNCEEVEVEKDKFFESVNYHFYKIIIPKKEPKITNCGNNNCQSGVINGVNPKICRKCNPKEEIKQERSYSDMQEYATFCIECDRKEMPLLLVEDWYKHYKINNMKDLELLEQELKSMLNNIERIKDFKREHEARQWQPCQSNVVGELKHRIVVLKQTLTRASNITTNQLFE